MTLPQLCLAHHPVRQAVSQSISQYRNQPAQERPHRRRRLVDWWVGRLHS